MEARNCFQVWSAKMSKFKDRFHLTPEQSLFLAKEKGSV